MGITIIPGEKLLIKMWDSLIDKCIIGSGRIILEPWRIRRNGRAEIYVKQNELLALTQAETNAKLILENKLQFDNKKFMITDKISIDSSSLTNEILYRELIKDINIAKAIVHAEDAIINETQDISDNENTISVDWLNLWRDNAGNVSDEKMQELWGKILAGEVKSPGKYSFRTLQFIRGLSKNEAQEISCLASYNFDGRIVKNFSTLPNGKGLNYFLKMQELGLIQGVDSLGLTITYPSTVPEKYNTAFIYNKTLIHVTGSDVNNHLKLDSLPFTSLGKEVISLCEFESDKVYIQEIIKLIINQGFKVELTDKWHFTDSGKNVQFSDMVEAKL